MNKLMKSKWKPIEDAIIDSDEKGFTAKHAGEKKHNEIKTIPKPSMAAGLGNWKPIFRSQ